MLGHILRRPDTPAFRTMKPYYATSNKKKLPGRPLTTLPQTSKKDVKLIPKIKFENSRETQSTKRLEQLDGDIIINIII